MLSQKMLNSLNNQIQHEIFSGHFYLAMAAYCASIDLEGFANFFIVQEQEERFHAMKFFNYIYERGGEVKLTGIDQPPIQFDSLEDVFDRAWKHEQKVTGMLNKLMHLAVSEKDFATQAILQWFISEQVEEEANMLNILKQLRLIDGQGHGILMLDREFALRQFTPPPAG